MAMDGWRVPGYTELRVLGAGGQGRVVLARHDATGAPAAIKYLIGDAAPRERFREEAGLLHRLRHPHIARLYGFVEHPGGAAIVMEAVDGASLKDVLARGGPLAPEAALTVLKGSLLGLAAAHGVGVVHRDYKPANVVVRADGLSKLIDFGIAVEAGAAGRSGTPVYMAPEQWRAEPASPATDVYAATCVFFECVTGRRPYEAGGQAELMERHLNAPVPSGELPPGLRPLVERGMAKDPWARPPGAAAFAAELERAASAAYGPDWEQRGVRVLAGAAAALAAAFPLAALGLAPSGGAAATGGTAAAGAGKGVLGLAASKTALAAAGAAVAVTAAGGAAYVVASSGHDRPPLKAVLASYRESTPALTTSGWIVQVKGGDPALARRINGALRAPVQARQERYRTSLKSSNAPPATASVKALPRLHGPRYVSARYDIGLQSTVLWHPTWSRSLTVNVDLRTGRPLTLAGMLTPEGTGAGGLRRLAGLLQKGATAGCMRERTPRLTTRALDGAEPALYAALDRTGLEVLVDEVALGSETACGQTTVRLAYADLQGLVRPEIVRAVS
ncbi:serine/threonine-protein kinase [Actinomadura macrotermitis]|uniref:Serine/threonine-protein kinase PknD n=1 Tax=Actinomadura macrotermitis TaxID=2585200 RepID=A0A7K0BPP5_9ACTN|nr:serine/threonine-protein kinase [Actinomadura macrotermitis]MQY03158.1 Serine/threonine-protein kinase PknD [Actinomadura macrotermitis]